MDEVILRKERWEGGAIRLNAVSHNVSALQLGCGDSVYLIVGERVSKELTIPRQVRQAGQERRYAAAATAAGREGKVRPTVSDGCLLQSLLT